MESTQILNSPLTIINERPNSRPSVNTIDSSPSTMSVHSDDDNLGYGESIFESLDLSLSYHEETIFSTLDYLSTTAIRQSQDSLFQ